MALRSWSWSAVVAVLAALPVWAGGPVVGQEAPDTTDGEWIEGLPTVGSVRALRGDVIVVVFWDAKDLQASRSLKPLTALAKPEDGVHLLTFASNATRELVLDRMRAARIDTMPVNGNGGREWQPEFRPYVWVVGVDGTIKFAGGPEDPKIPTTVRDEAKNVRYAGLGRVEFDKAVQRALDKYKRHDLEAARKDARKVADDAKASEAARADAADLLERLARIGAGQRTRGEFAERSGRIGFALEIWQEVVDQWGKEPEGVHAKARLTALTSDPAIARELQAGKAWKQLKKQLEGKSNEEQYAALVSFTNEERYAATAAAEEAKAMLNSLPAPAQPGSGGPKR